MLLDSIFVNVPALIGDAIREARVKRLLSQNTLADNAGLSRNSISEIERGTREIGIETLHSICEAMGVRMSGLLSDIDL
jgi:transcriptional regulator with XRE-family HTH domain